METLKIMFTQTMMQKLGALDPTSTLPLEGGGQGGGAAGVVL